MRRRLDLAGTLMHRQETAVLGRTHAGPLPIPQARRTIWDYLPLRHQPRGVDVLSLAPTTWTEMTLCRDHSVYRSRGKIVRQGTLRRAGDRNGGDLITSVQDG